MASRIALDASSHLEAELAVELRGLKVVSLQHNLVTVPHPGLLLDRLHQPRAVALLSHVGWDDISRPIQSRHPVPTALLKRLRKCRRPLVSLLYQKGRDSRIFQVRLKTARSTISR